MLPTGPRCASAHCDSLVRVEDRFGKVVRVRRQRLGACSDLGAQSVGGSVLGMAEFTWRAMPVLCALPPNGSASSPWTCCRLLTALAASSSRGLIATGAWAALAHRVGNASRCSNKCVRTRADCAQMSIDIVVGIYGDAAVRVRVVYKAYYRF